MHRLVTGILSQACGRHGQAYVPKATAADAAICIEQPVQAGNVMAPTRAAMRQHSEESHWAQQPLELKVHLCATSCMFGEAVVSAT